jgi:hypothetical protein
VSPAERSPDPLPRYGDYPALFWDLDPAAPVDPEQPSVLARILTMAELETVFQLAPEFIIRRDILTVPIPEHTRLFWEMVLNFPGRRARGGPASPTRRPRSDPPRCGDYPELFWDLKPDALIPRDNPTIIARILREGSMQMIAELISLEVLEREFPDLILPEPTRRYWTVFLETRRQRIAAARED